MSFTPQKARWKKAPRVSSICSGSDDVMTDEDAEIIRITGEVQALVRGFSRRPSTPANVQLLCQQLEIILGYPIVMDVTHEIGSPEPILNIRPVEDHKAGYKFTLRVLFGEVKVTSVHHTSYSDGT